MADSSAREGLQPVVKAQSQRHGGVQQRYRLPYGAQCSFRLGGYAHLAADHHSFPGRHAGYGRCQYHQPDTGTRERFTDEAHQRPSPP